MSYFNGYYTMTDEERLRDILDLASWDHDWQNEFDFDCIIDEIMELYKIKLNIIKYFIYKNKIRKQIKKVALEFLKIQCLRNNSITDEIENMDRAMEKIINILNGRE